MEELPRERGVALAACHGFEFHPVLLQPIAMEGEVDAWGDKCCAVGSLADVF